MTATAVEGRACLTCGTFKPWTDFPLGKGANGRRGHCKPCHCAANVEYNRRNRGHFERVAAPQRIPMLRTLSPRVPHREGLELPPSLYLSESPPYTRHPRKPIGATGSSSPQQCLVRFSL